MLGFIFCIFAFINFYYFATFNNKIDAYIFNIRDDSPQAVLSIIWHDYPILLMLSISLVCGIIAICLYNLKLLKLQNFFSKCGKIAQILAFLVFIIVLIIAARGSLGTFPIKEDNHYISNIAIFNHLATNPLIAFDWAHTNYMDNTSYALPSIAELKSLESSLFSIFHKTPDSKFLAQNPPHIVLNLMESFGSNMLLFDDKATNDLLGSLRGHLQSDFTFYRFLSFGNGTSASFSQLFFGTPASIPLGNYKRTKLALNPFEIYANAGYEVIYITSGYASWNNLGEFITTQGAHKVYDVISLFEKYPKSKLDESAYGTADEWIYKLVLEILESASKPTFIAILTTSNHPPYHLPSHYSALPIDIARFYNSSTYGDTARLKLSATLYQYANDSFGKFLSAIKGSKLAKNTIIAATGDHKFRDLANNPTTHKALAHAVPLYLYVPKAYRQNLHYDATRIGSHKDIFPTLYALSLSNAPYISVGGRNILAKKDNKALNFAYNELVWMDNRGIYLPNSAVGYKWLDSKAQGVFSLLSSDEAFVLDSSQARFMQDYQRLLNLSIAYRLHATFAP